MLLLVLRDLQHRRWRVIVVAVLVAIVVTLLFVMTGLVNQFNREPVFTTQRTGASHNWVVAETSTGPLTSATAAPPGAVESVEGAIPFLLGLASLNGERTMVVGRADALDEPVITDGVYPTGPGEIMVDVSAGYELGDEVVLGGRPATVVGVTSDATILAGVPLTFATLAHTQAILAEGQPALVGGLVESLPAAGDLPEGMKVMTAEEVAADGLVPLENAISSVGLIRALLWLMTLIIIAAVIYVTALERTRDFAVLKAVGADGRTLALTLIVQGLLITLLAVALAAVLQTFVVPAFPMQITVPSSAFWQIPLGGAIVALIAGIAGARRAANTPAAEAFE